jgi:ankyrin repeat protein
MADNEVIIEGEIVDNNWFLSAIKGDIKSIVSMAKKNAGKKGENGRTAMMYAANGGHLECVKFLTEFKQEVRNQDYDGNTALIYAAKKGYADCVKILVIYESGMKNNDNKTAYDYAVDNKDKVCMRILQDKIDSDGDIYAENLRLKEKLERLNKVNKEIDRGIGSERGGGVTR